MCRFPLDFLLKTQADCAPGSAQTPWAWPGGPSSLYITPCLGTALMPSWEPPLGGLAESSPRFGHAAVKTHKLTARIKSLGNGLPQGGLGQVAWHRCPRRFSPLRAQQPWAGGSQQGPKPGDPLGMLGGCVGAPRLGYRPALALTQHRAKGAPRGSGVPGE